MTLPTTSVALPATDASLFGPGRTGATIGAVALVSLLAFEAMAVAAAMPAVAGALDGLAWYALAFGGMLATSVLGMVWAGHACDRHGARRTTALGLAVFAVGLLLAGFAGGMGTVVAGRIVQGLGGGMLGVALYVGMGQLVPPALHPRLFALFAAAWVLPGLLGPIVATRLVEQFGWRALFLVVAAAVPPAAALLLPAFGRLPGRSSAPAPAGQVGWALLAAAGALLLHAAAAARSPFVTAAALALGLAAAGAAARRLLPPGSLVARTGLPSVIALRGLLAAAFASAEVFVPLYLTRAGGWSLAQAGLVLSAAAVLWSCGSAVQARLRDEARRRRGLRAGFGLVVGGLGMVAAPMAAGLPDGLVVAGWSLAGFGIGLAFPMLSVLTLSLSAPSEQGRHASALQLSDALGSSAALALAGALFDPGAGARPFAWVLAPALALAAAGAWLAPRAFARPPAAPA